MTTMEQIVQAMQVQRDEARALSALFVMGMISDEATLGEAKQRARDILNALRLAQSALEAVEWNESEGEAWCAWCDVPKFVLFEDKPPYKHILNVNHKPDCPRQLALDAIKGVRG